MPPTTPSGRLIRKIQCHDATWTSQPPSVGPTSGPIKPGIVTKLIAARNSCRGTTRSTTSRPTGRSIAPPTPCSTRAATSWIRPARHRACQRADGNSTTAATNTRRVPNRSASQPDAGITIATASAYDATTACIRSGDSPRPIAIDGSAVLTIVVSSICMNAAVATSQSIGRSEDEDGFVGGITFSMVGAIRSSAITAIVTWLAAYLARKVLLSLNSTMMNSAASSRFSAA